MNDQDLVYRLRMRAEIAAYILDEIERGENVMTRKPAGWA